MKQPLLSDNEYRQYPFTESSNRTLPQDVVVDFFSVVTLRTDTPYVAFNGIRRTAGNFHFDFTYSGLPWRLEFVVPENAAEFTMFTANAIYTDLREEGSLGDFCDDSLIWQGVLTIGKLDTLASVLLDEHALLLSSTYVLSTRLQDLQKTRVAGVSLANKVRLRTTAPAGCPPLEFDDLTVDDYVMWTRCLRPYPGKPIRFVEGYNTTIRLNTRDNSITTAAWKGLGAGEPCGEIITYPDETKPDGSLYYEAGPACNEVITSVNGLSASVIQLKAGPGVSITKTPDDDYGVTVDFDGTGISLYGGLP